MIRKLSLSDFLAGYTSQPDDITHVRKESTENLTFPLSGFCDVLLEHRGSFLINDIVYESVIPSDTNIYFFSEATNDEFMVIFDPIVDIKCKDSMFTVFYYPDQIITILLRDSNGKEDSCSENT